MFSALLAASPVFAGTFTVLHTQAAGDYAVQGGYATGLKVLDGEIYIANMEGGAQGVGTLLRLDAPTGNVTVVHSFTAKLDGAFPRGLVLGQGNLYGATAGAGTPSGRNAGGTLFKAIPSLDQVHTFLHFPKNSAYTYPQAPVYLSSGLYDVTGELLYKFDFMTKTATSLPLLNGQDYTAVGGLVASGSVLYGIAAGDAAVGGSMCLYSLDSVTQQQAIVHVFSGVGTDTAFKLQVSDGQNLLYGILEDSQVVAFDTASDTLRVVHTFQASSRAGLPSELIVGPGGLYGTTPGNGNSSATIFEIKLPSGQKSDLYEFSSGPVTGAPEVLTYSNGVFYGAVTNRADNNLLETVFSFTP